MADKIQHSTDAMPTDLKFSLLEKITGNFSEEHQIGHGGYGIVYKVRLIFMFSIFQLVALY